MLKIPYCIVQPEWVDLTHDFSRSSLALKLL